MYSRRETQDHVTRMNKDLYDNLQDGIEENRDAIEDNKTEIQEMNQGLSENRKDLEVFMQETSSNFQGVYNNMVSFENTVKENFETLENNFEQNTTEKFGELESHIEDTMQTLETAISLSSEVQERYNAEELNQVLLNNIQEIVCTIPATSWSSEMSDGWYTAKVNVSGMKQVFNPIATLVITSADTFESESESFGLIAEIETFDDYIIARALEKPSNDISVRFSGV